MNIHNRESNKQVFFSLEFVNILLQIEAKTVKKMRLHFFNSAVIANSKMDYYGTYLGSIFFLVSYKVANGLLQPCRLVLYGFDSYVMLIQGRLTNDDGDGYENVTQKENIALLQTLSRLLQLLANFVGV